MAMSTKDEDQRNGSAPEARAKVVPIREGIDITPPPPPWWADGSAIVEFMPPYFAVVRGGKGSE
jgi:hypothetical protein